jgi:hypothetical protein
MSVPVTPTNQKRLSVAGRTKSANSEAAKEAKEAREVCLFPHLSSSA